MRWLRAEVRGLRPTELAYVLADVALLLLALATFYFTVTTLVPWCGA